MAQTRPQRKCLFLPAAGSFHDVIWRPAADIYRTRTGWLAKFDLAGIDPQEIHIGVEGRCLCVHGVRRAGRLADLKLDFHFNSGEENPTATGNHAASFIRRSGQHGCDGYFLG